LKYPQIHFDPARSDERASVGIATLEVVHLGYRYAGAAVIAPRATLPSQEDLTLDLDGSPGTRLPHVWLERRGEPISTLDLVSESLALLAGPRGEEWCAAARVAGAGIGLDLPAYRLGPGGDIATVTTDWQTAAGIEDDGALLVRPDGFVAWRAVHG